MTKEKETKLTASEKRAAKRREAAAKAEQLFGTGKGSDEPILNPLDYNASLMHALNYYNAAFDTKAKRKWTYSYLGKAKAAALDTLSDFDCKTKNFRSLILVLLNCLRKLKKTLRSPLSKLQKLLRKTLQLSLQFRYKIVSQ